MSRASDDVDGDSVSNLTEYLAGTNPNNAASVPVLPPFNITQIATTSTNVQLSASSTTNWSCQLQFRASLDPSSSWINVGPAVSGTGGTILLGDPNSSTNATRFYRVQAY